MSRRDRIVTVITVSLLNLFTMGASFAVVNLTPERRLEPSPPAVADRLLIQPGDSLVSPVADTGPLPDISALTTRLTSLLGTPGANVSAIVMDASSHQIIYDRQANVPAVPASTTKVLTSVAVLSELGPGARLTTKVVQGGDAAGPAAGDTGGTAGPGDPAASGSAQPQDPAGSAGGEQSIVLVGGGDPTLSALPSSAMTGYPRPASLADLAKRTAAVLKAEGTTRVRVDYDVSAYQGARTAASWKPNYVSDGEVAPVTALMVNAGRVALGAKARVVDPAGFALRSFLGVLRANGIDAEEGDRTTAGVGARELAAVQSPTIATLVEETLTSSDNDLAEALARQVAIKRGNTPDFAGSAAAVTETLTGLGVHDGVQINDGSGLSPRNQVTPQALARTLTLAVSTGQPELRAAATGLPVAGFSGTLAQRYILPSSLPGAGIVRAKTGTLAGVSTLAGLAYDADGRLLVFALMANEVKSDFDAPALLDSLAAAIAGCGCG